jgi:hypothetical protein
LALDVCINLYICYNIYNTYLKDTYLQRNEEQFIKADYELKGEKGCIRKRLKRLFKVIIIPSAEGTEKLIFITDFLTDGKILF